MYNQALALHDIADKYQSGNNHSSWPNQAKQL
jgi:hypothetical protein